MSDTPKLQRVLGTEFGSSGRMLLIAEPSLLPQEFTFSMIVSKPLEVYLSDFTKAIF